MKRSDHGSHSREKSPPLWSLYYTSFGPVSAQQRLVFSRVAAFAARRPERGFAPTWGSFALKGGTPPLLSARAYPCCCSTLLACPLVPSSWCGDCVDAQSAITSASRSARGIRRGACSTVHFATIIGGEFRIVLMLLSFACDPSVSCAINFEYIFARLDTE